MTEIAQMLEVSKASVTEMVSKLKNNELVFYEKYGTISLTEKGREIAVKIKDRHEILLSFLLFIGVSPENANNDCCSMEHDLSEETVEKIRIFMKFLKSESQDDILNRFKKYAEKVE